MRLRGPMALVGVALPVGCAVVAGLGDPAPFPAEAGTRDSGGPRADAGHKDASREAMTTHETGPLDSSRTDGAISNRYSTLGDSTKWEFFDLAPLPKSAGFLGGAVVGRYVYFASDARSILRYDTSTPFAFATSWVVADSATLPVSNAGLVAFGRYVYDTPLFGGYDVGRYDTAAALDGGVAAFGAFEPTSVAGIDFQGGCTDRKTVYFVPWQSHVGAGVGLLLTYDPAGAGFFTDSSWTVTDLTVFNPQAVGLATCVFDGRYVYFGNNREGTTARFDTTLPVSSPGAWVFFQVDQLAADLYGFAGVVYTGRYVVFVPGFSAAYSAAAVAYDTKGKFGEVTSWTQYSLTATDGGKAATGYAGGQFDGRYVYLAPQTSGLVMRWDSTRPFDEPAAWDLYDVNALHPGATRFYGTAFDGEYVYFSSHAGTTMARFRARDTPFHADPPSSFL